MNAHHRTTWRRVLAYTIVALVLAQSVGCRPAPTVPPPTPYTTAAATVSEQNTPTPTVAAQAIATSTATATETPTETAVPSTLTPVPPTLTPTNAPTDTPIPATVGMTSPDYGIQAFLWWRPEVASRDLGLIRDMGFRWVKQVFAWSDIEGAKKGHFNWDQADSVVRHADEAGIKLLARLDRAPAWTGAVPPNGPPQRFEDFGDFCYEVATRYRGKIHAYQIWNEPNLAREWGNRPPNPEEYVRLLAIAYQRIKEADPNAIVISAGLTPTGTMSDLAMPDTVYLERMYQAGFQNYVDMVGLHAAGFKAPPELSPDEAAADKERYGGERFFCFRHVEDMRAIMEKYGDSSRRVVILEFGWTSDTIHPEYAWHAVTEEQKADYMVRAYQWARDHWQPWIGLMSLIYIADSNWKDDREESWWAITAPGYPEANLRPAYHALRNMPKE